MVSDALKAQLEIHTAVINGCVDTTCFDDIPEKPSEDNDLQMSAGESCIYNQAQQEKGRF